MILNIDVSGKEFVVTKAPEAKTSNDGVHRTDKVGGLPLWQTELVVTDESGGEIIRVTTVGLNAPDVERGEDVDMIRLIAIPWFTNGRSGVAYRADGIVHN